MATVVLDAVGITLQLEDVDRDLAGSLAQLQGAHEAVRASVENARAKVRRVIEGIRNAEKEAAEASGRPAFDEGDPTEARSLKERLYDLETLNPDTWQELGTGYFGTVYRAFVQGTEVAIKVLTEDKEQAILKEYCQLRELRHDNIVAIRDLGQLKEGCIPRLGLLKPFRFLMMEHVGVNLATYVARQEERSPRLPRSRTWDIMRQVVSALNYLHTLADPIAHCDLKPDNILIDEHVLDLRVKLVDFGISRKRGNLSELQEFTRWSAPELVGKDIASDADPMMPYIKGDIWTVGLLIYFMQTGLEPYGSRTDNAVKEEAIEVAQALYQALLQSPELPDDVLLQIQMQCLQPEGKPRPTARQLLDTFFKDGRNPYLSEEKKADFFTFGFLRDTKIFVADSVIGNVVEGENGHRPTLGYRPRYLSCVIDKKKLEGPTLEYDAAAYRKRRREYGKMVKENKIFDGQTYALVGLTTSRCGAMETHVISLRLKETMYVHHRVMREMWMTLEEREKLKQVSCKMQVHPFYSTSLGVHIAVLTNEGGGKKKFIFTRRSNRTGIATPSMWTCGAVETLSVNDVETKVKGRKKKEIRMVRLLRTAARGLEEELNIVLTSEGSHPPPPFRGLCRHRRRHLYLFFHRAN
ncbi:uncharacterized protein LOC116950918 [Petromyzon marinus]|uniref:uncharacterized protein LOC116950918 n=1 Tax=Petromyzon marinus TaxID=7757 RepID=UPI003F72900A